MNFKIILSIIGAIIILSCNNQKKQLNNGCIVTSQDFSTGHMVWIEYDTCSNYMIIKDSLTRIIKKGYWSNDSLEFTGIDIEYYENTFFPKYEYSIFKNVSSGYHKNYFESDSGHVKKEWLGVKCFGTNYVDKQVTYDINGNEIKRECSILVQILDSNIFLGDTFRVAITPKKTKKFPNNDIYINNTRYLFEDKQNARGKKIQSEKQGDSYIIEQVAITPGLNYLSGSVFNYYTLEKKEGEFGYSYFFLEEYIVKQK